TNLSNHPSSGWSAEQYDYAASRWGEIQDIAFPKLGPEISGEEVLQLVKEYLDRLPAKEEGPVFVSGEYSFTYAMVDELLNRGYRAMFVRSENTVSTTMHEDGSSERMMGYRFVRFEDYERITAETENITDTEPVFLNCSCHYASTGWDDEALKQAAFYGSVMDLPLYPITETGDEKYKKAELFIKQVDSIRPSAVLLDGEFGTFFMMTDALLKKGYRVLVKCSERISRDQVGTDSSITKVSEYRFVRYRRICVSKSQFK
ncbi:MAG: hypothetical protein K6G42_07610, partial [Lachnospiraceae bacterium]|nr:hypothetical protein [Lachnospiraceae bacterium]